MSELPNPDRMAPLRAAPVSDIGANWLVAWSTGYSVEGGDWCIQTDRVRASDLAGCDFPSDAKSDAHAIVAIVNAYREGRLVLTDTSRR